MDNEIEVLTKEVKKQARVHFLQEVEKEENAGETQEELTPNRIAELQASQAKLDSIGIALPLPVMKLHAPKDPLRFLYCAVMAYKHNETLKDAAD